MHHYATLHLQQDKYRPLRKSKQRNKFKVLSYPFTSIISSLQEYVFQRYIKIVPEWK